MSVHDRKAHGMNSSSNELDDEDHADYHGNPDTLVAR